MNKLHCLLFASVVVVAACVQTAWAQTVIYSDSFNRTTGSGDPNFLPADPDNFSDWGMNDNAMGGTVQMAYFVGPGGRSGGANQVTDGSVATMIAGGGMFDFDVATVAPGGFTVAFEFNRFHPINPGTGNGFIAMGLGRTVPDDATTYGPQGALNGSDFAILFQQGVDANVGNTQIFQDDDGTGSSFLPGTAATGPLDYGDPTATHAVLLTMTPAVAGAYGDSDVINFTLEVDGSASFSSSVLGGDDFGRLAFSANPFVHRYIDNLVVTALPFTAVDDADFNGDTKVDGTDFLIWQRGFGTGATLAEGDANNSGTVDGADLAIWESQFGTEAVVATGFAVPEPGAIVLTVAGVAGAWFVGRRRH